MGINKNWGLQLAGGQGVGVYAEQLILLTNGQSKWQRTIPIGISPIAKSTSEWKKLANCVNIEKFYCFAFFRWLMKLECSWWMCLVVQLGPASSKISMKSIFFAWFIHISDSGFGLTKGVWFYILQALTSHG